MDFKSALRKSAFLLLQAACTSDIQVMYKRSISQSEAQELLRDMTVDVLEEQEEKAERRRLLLVPTIRKLLMQRCCRRQCFREFSVDDILAIRAPLAGMSRRQRRVFHATNESVRNWVKHNSGDLREEEGEAEAEEQEEEEEEAVDDEEKEEENKSAEESAKLFVPNDQKKRPLCVKAYRAIMHINKAITWRRIKELAQSKYPEAIEVRSGLLNRANSSFFVSLMKLVGSLRKSG